MIPVFFILASALTVGGVVNKNNTPEIPRTAQMEDVGGTTIEAGCDASGWCWRACTIPEGWRIKRVDDPGDIAPGQRGEYAFALMSARIIVLPQRLQHRAKQNGWTLAMLTDHELAHACWQTHRVAGLDLP